MELSDAGSLSDSDDRVVLRRNQPLQIQLPQIQSLLPPCRFNRRILCAANKSKPSFATLSGEIRNSVYQLLSNSIGAVTQNTDKHYSCSLLLVCSGTLGEFGDYFYSTKREWRVKTLRNKIDYLHAPLMIRYLLSVPNIVKFYIQRAEPPTSSFCDLR